MLLEAFLPSLVATVVGSVIAVVGYLVARRAGLGPVQAEYVRNLEGNNRMLNERLDLLEEEIKRERLIRSRLARKVIRLEQTVIALADENEQLRKRLSMPKRAHSPLDDAVLISDEHDEELTEDGDEELT